MCDDLERSLRECATKEVEEPFEQASRPVDGFRLGNHPAFRGIGGVSPGGGGGGGGEQDYDGGYDEAAAMAEVEAARREREALVVKVGRWGGCVHSRGGSFCGGGLGVLLMCLCLRLCVCVASTTVLCNVTS